MAAPEDNSPSPEYARDIRIFDAEPWVEHGPVDELIVMQKQAFQADRAGNFGQFGLAVMSMSKVEGSIGNHSEAAAYATEAAVAFEQAGQLDSAISAHATLAREHRTLDSPDLAFASLQEVIRLTINSPTDSILDISKPMPNSDVMPILRLIKSFTAGYLSSGLVYYDTEDIQYPAPLLPKGFQRPSQDAANRLAGDVWRLNGAREAVPEEEFDQIFFRTEMLGKNLSDLSWAAAYSSKTRLGRIAAIIFGI